MMHLESKTYILTLLTIKSPVAQWLEHPTRSRMVVGSKPIWGSDFSEFPMGLLTFHFKGFKNIPQKAEQWFHL